MFLTPGQDVIQQIHRFLELSIVEVVHQSP